MTQRPEELGQQLRQLHAQIRGTKYSTMMKLLRLTLSGLQVSLPPLSWAWLGRTALACPSLRGNRYFPFRTGPALLR